MAFLKDELSRRFWTRGDFLISTDSTLIPVKRIVDIFDSNQFHWARSLPAKETREMLDNSLCFGLYKDKLFTAGQEADPADLIGFARLVTDFATFAYLTDVWVDSHHQGRGLGSWIIECVKEAVESMPYLRRTILFTSDWQRTVPFYERLMDAKLMEVKRGEGMAIMGRLGRGHQDYRRDKEH